MPVLRGLILLKVVSGGQTGVDQAALRAALQCGLEIGGWCPPGRACDSGFIPDEFRLVETPAERSPDAAGVPRSMRTEWNVRDSDASLILQPRQAIGVDPGTQWAATCAAHYRRPWLSADPFDGISVEQIFRWLRSTDTAVLNVAGPGESAFPGIGQTSHELLIDVFSRVAQPPKRY